MKIIVLVIATLFLFSPNLLRAQEPKEEIHNKYRHEVTFLGRNFDEVGLGYRLGTKKALWRISTTVGVNQMKEESSGLHTRIISSSNISLEIGREYRFEVADNLFLRTGGDLFYEHFKSTYESGPDAQNQFLNSGTENEYGIKLVSGFLYQLTKNIHLGFELTPSFSFRTRNFIWRDNNTIQRFTSIRLDKSVFRFNIGFNF